MKAETILATALRNACRDSHMRTILLKLARRVGEKGALTGRLKLGTNLPNDRLLVLLSLFPIAAVERKSNGDTVLRLERITEYADEEQVWIRALATLLRNEQANQPADTDDHQRTWQTILARCRLLHPGLDAVWRQLERQPGAFRRQVGQRGAETVQNELLALADAVHWLRGTPDPLGLMELSARFFGDSKILKTRPALLATLQDALITMRYGELNDAQRQELRPIILQEHGVVENATASKVTLFGPLVYTKRGKRYDGARQLFDAGESTTLSWDNLDGIESLELPPGTPLYSCENETPFNQLIRDRHPGLIVYTAGYPNSAVRRLVKLLPESNGPLHHWGDTDLDGLAIASILNEIRPTHLWRCELDDVKRMTSRLKPLSDQQKRRAEVFLRDHPEFVFRRELEFTLEHGWLEQEQWRKESWRGKR